MFKVGRFLISTGFLGLAAAVVLALAGGGTLLQDPALFRFYKLVWATTSPALFGGWILAVFHWGTRYPGADRTKGRWGVAVILGMFIGALLYWWVAARPPRERTDSTVRT